MADEFAIGGSFGGSSYNPFDPLAGLGLGGSSSSATGSSPVATGSAASTTSGSSSSGNTSGTGSSGWGGVLQNIVDTAVGWGSQVLALDIFNRAQSTNQGSTTTTGTATGTTTTTSTGTGTATTMIAGVPSWLVYGGLGFLLLLVILKLVKG